MAQEYWQQNDEYNDNNNNNYEEDNNQDWSIKPVPNAILSTSMSHFPCALMMEENAKLRYGLAITPLAELEEPLPTITRLTRCRNCRAYICPYNEITTNGMRHQWSCVLCGATNDTTKEHYEQYCRGECPEMTHCGYDLLAPGDWENSANPLQSPNYLFVLHTHKHLIETGVFANFCDTIKQVLNSEDSVFSYSKTAKIGFMTFSNKVQYYYLSKKSTSQRPKTFECADVNDVVLPIDAHALMVNVSENLQEINNFLDMLPKLFQKANSTENSLGTAMQSAMFIMQRTGGKCITLSHNLASLGKGKVMNRSGTASDLLQPATDYYTQLADLMAGSFQVAIDLFQTLSSNKSFCDMATIKGLCHTSGGKLHFYSDLRREQENIYNDLHKLLSREHGWHGSLRMRLSKGIYSARKWMANYGRNRIQEAQLNHIEKQSCPLLCLSTFDSDKTICITLSNKDAAADEDWVETQENSSKINSQFAYCQVGILFTSQRNVHIIRVLTIQIPLATNYKVLYDGVNVQTMNAITAKQATYRMLSGEYGLARLFVQRACMSALIAYNQNVDANNTFQSLNDYPPSMRLWPLMTLGLLKCRAFAPMQDVARWDTVDSRAALFVQCLDLTVSGIELMCRPSLYRMDDIIYLDDESLEDEYWIPEELPLESQSIAPDGVYLLNNGQELLIFIGPNVAADVIRTFLQRKDGFGLLSLMDAEKNKYAQKFHSILQYLQAINYRHQTIKFISANDDSNGRTQSFYKTYLIHDRTESVMSYEEFLLFVHQEVGKSRFMRRGSEQQSGVQYY